MSVSLTVGIRLGVGVPGNPPFWYSPAVGGEVHTARRSTVGPVMRDAPSWSRRTILLHFKAVHMSIVQLLAVAGLVCGGYSGLRAIGLLFGSIRRLGGSRRFARLSPPEQLQAFMSTPASDPRFRRYATRFFACCAVAMALLGLVPPAPNTGAPPGRMPFFAMAALMALSAAGMAAGSRGLAVGALGWCEPCGCEMQLIGLGQQGGVFMDRAEMLYGYGVAEQCRECGRLYCSSCYPQRGRACICGRGAAKVHRERGAVYRGSLRLVKVRY